jgi:hypothetical protein
LKNVEWGEFKIGDLFEIGTGSLVDIKSANEGKTPRISVQTTDNGILGYFDESIENVRYFENFISVNFFGISYYHPYRASVEMKVHTLKLKNRDFINSEGIFISAMINKRFDGLFSYGSQLSSSKLKNDDFKIQLPTKNGKIDFEFMESFIAELEAERVIELEAEKIAELEAYLIATGLKDYTLTVEEQQALDDFENHKIIWREFRIEDVLIWQQKITELNPLHLDSLTLTDEKKYPFYGQATVNNGIIEYRHLVDDVLNNKKGKSTILIHSNNQNTVYLETPFYLKDGHGATSVLQSDYLNKLNTLFFISSIKKVILNKYSYNAKATKIELKNTLIYLPVQNTKPDYSIMETLISAIQKLVIKEVVLYADRKIAATKKVI